MRPWICWEINTHKMELQEASGGDGIPVELFQILKDDAVKVFHSICQQIWKTQQWPQDWKRSVFIQIPKKANAKKCSYYCTVALISHNGNPLQYSCLENPMDGGAWWAAVHGVARSRTRLSDFTFTFTFIHWRRKWQPTPVFLPGESQGWGSLVGCRLWGRIESDTTEVT